jgi:hypothetical protein
MARPPLRARAALALLALALLALPSSGRAADQPAQASGVVRASPLETSTRRPARARGTGAVLYASATRVYLDAGAAEGLAAGAAVAFRRGGERAGRCEVDLVADHQASCAAKGPRAGDTFTFEATAEPAGPKLLPPPPSDEALQRRAAVLAAAPAPAAIAYQAPADRPRPRAARRIAVEVGGDAWTVVSGGGDPLGAARVNLSSHGAPVGAGVTLDVDLRAERWLPDPNPRFRAEDASRLYVWRAQLTAPLRSATLAAGRVLPVGIPGATIFDGASAALRLGRAEVGIFGGLVPEVDTTAPTADRATGGAFWAVERPLSRGAALRHDGRLAVVQSPELGTRGEATLAGHLFSRKVDLSAEAQLGAGGDVEAPGFLDAARVDLSARPGGGFTVGGGFRHTALEWPDPLGEPARFPGAGDAADAFLAWDAGGLLRLAATGGLSRDDVSGLDRQWIGPEVGMPRLFGSAGGISLGYLEEAGWLEGRSAWLQTFFRARGGLRLSGRASWFHDASFGSDRHEAGLSASASGPLGGHLAWRASVLGRVPLSDTRADVPVGLVASASLVARY